MDTPKKAEMLKRARKRAEKKSYGIMFNKQEGGKFYAPSRDFAHNYPHMIDTIVKCFNEDYWPELFALYTEMYGQTSAAAFDELEKAKDIYCKFINESYKDPNECCDDVLRRVGWLDVPVETQTTWLAMLGQIMTGQLFAGVRDLYMATEIPLPADIEVFMEHGHDARRAMNKIDKTTEVKSDIAAAFRESIREAREKGFSFDEIKELVEDVKYGRVPSS